MEVPQVARQYIEVRIELKRGRTTFDIETQHRDKTDAIVAIWEKLKPGDRANIRIYRNHRGLLEPEEKLWLHKKEIQTI